MENLKSNLRLVPINDLLGQHFYIPDYQRGYRWGKRQVNELLQDILEFATNPERTPKDIYCLQPIVIKKKEDSWELVDGQQRLTTAYLILHYFNSRLAEEFRKELFSLSYQTRRDSKDYLSTLNPALKDKNIDYFHIYQAFELIKEWFGPRQNMVQVFESALLNDVKIIWYELQESTNAIEVFTRLNMGKIPLNNSELIKALFLRESNFGNEETADSYMAKLGISTDWDRIENTLQKDHFWYFISNNASATDNRIEYIFQLMAQESFGAIPQNDELATFIAFHQHFKTIIEDPNSTLNVQDEWKKVKGYFMTFEEWYESPYLFNLIGYLIYCGVSVLEIKSAAHNITKTTFRQWIKERVYQVLLNKKLLANQVEDDLQEMVDALVYNKRAKVEQVLLLFNVLSLLEGPRPNMHFQFDRYKEEDWDIEHIRAVKSLMPTAQNQRAAWLRHLLEFFTGAEDESKQDKIVAQMDDGPERKLAKKALQVASSLNKENFETLYQKVLEHFQENDEYKELDTLENLALLNTGINRAYKNAVFPQKRKKIIAADKTGKFVPVCTKNVFLKYYSPQIDNMFFWRREDGQAYKKAIVNTLSAFFNS